jgi:hypothetical protein
MAGKLEIRMVIFTAVCRFLIGGTGNRCLCFTTARGNFHYFLLTAIIYNCQAVILTIMLAYMFV